MPEETVNNGGLPGLQETRDLLERLKDTVSGFARREQELTQEARRKAYVLRKAHDEAVEAEEGRLAAKTSAAEASFQSRAQGLETRYERRKEWILLAHRNARRGLISRISKSEGQRKYALQRQTLEWKRGHE